MNTTTMTANSILSQAAATAVVPPKATFAGAAGQHSQTSDHIVQNIDAFFATYEGLEERLDDNFQQLEQLIVEYDAASERTTAQPDATWKVVPRRETYFVPPLKFQPPEGFLLTIVIPAYNEVRTIERVIDRVFALPLEKEVIVVDDCSLDGTGRVLRNLLGRPGLRVLFKEKNEGKGAALRDGFRAAKGDVIVVQDADLEYDPRDIPKLVEAILFEGHDVVYGSRYLTGAGRDDWWHHRGNALLTEASNLLTGLRLTDMETCYKAFKRRVIERIEIKQNRFGFEPEFTAKIARRGFRIREVPIGYQARSYADGKKIRFRDALNALYCIARYAICD